MITIVDYGMGNLGSIHNMLRKIGVESAISGDPAAIEQADAIILPGVGAFDRGMRQIRDRGLLGPLRHAALERKIPVLGICLGMQLLFEASEEGSEAGLGWIAGDVVRFRIDPTATHLKVPHMGWNVVEPHGAPALFEGLEEEARFYFVHSYHVQPRDPADVLATCDHGYRFAASVQRENVSGTQFHPEKSHRFGMRLLENFAEAAC